MRSRRILTSLLLLSFVACTSVLQAPERAPASLYFAKELPWTEPIDFASFKETLRLSSSSNVDGFLNYFFQHYPNYSAFHTLIYNSFSIQSASYQFPRVILFGTNAKFVMSFNARGDASNAIEIMMFDDLTQSFELREVTFKSGAERSDTFRGENYRISEANPAKCLGCHSGFTENHWQVAAGKKFDDSIHPIWDQYFLWRGAYGSFDDNQPKEISTKKTFLYANENTIEKAEFAKFMAPEGNRHKGRYKHLPAQRKIVGPNGDLGSAFAAENFGRITRRITNAIANGSASGLMKYKLSMLAAITCEPGTSFDFTYDKDFLDNPLVAPPELRGQMRKDLEETRARSVAEYAQLQMNMEKLEGQQFVEPYVNRQVFFDVYDRQISPIQTLARFYGIKTDDWAMNATIGGTGFAYGENRVTLFSDALLKNLFTYAERKALGEDPIVKWDFCYHVLQKINREHGS